MAQLVSHATLLLDELNGILTEIVQVLEASTLERYIKQQNPFASIASAYSPEQSRPPRIGYRWAEPDTEVAARQSKLNRRYSTWFQLFKMLFMNSPQGQLAEIANTNAMIESWIKYRYAGRIPSSVREAVEACKQTAQRYFNILNDAIVAARDRYIIIVDTSAIVDAPDVQSYGRVIGHTDYTVVILPTVIAELDGLKKARRENVGPKASQIIKQVESWQAQGNILQGIPLSTTVTVKMTATEPNFAQAPSWFDPTVNDDRIIVSALEVQRDHPDAIVSLMASDVNMRNKAQVAYLPCIKPSDVVPGTSP